jgi:hypothetical protein
MVRFAGINLGVTDYITVLGILFIYQASFQKYTIGF